ncbi:hypothetical protein Tco_0031205 [Tanacetum coccineum]
MLPPRKRFNASPSTSQQETIVEAMIKAVTPGLGLSSNTTTPMLPVTGETIYHTIPLLVTRLAHHDRMIDEIYDHLEELPLEHFESTEIDRLEMAELQSQAQDAEALLNQCEIGRIRDRVCIRRMRVTLA